MQHGYDPSYHPICYLTIINTCREVFLDRIQSQEEIHRLIEEVFGERKRITLEEFQEIVEKITSEMFLAVRRLHI